MDRRGFQIRLGDAIYSMQYAVYIYIYIYVYITILYDIYIIYIYIHTMILYMLLTNVDICEELPRLC